MPGIIKRALDGSGKPLGKSPLQESKVMTAEECALLIMRAIEKRDRLLITSLRGKLGRWMKLIAPELVDKIVAKAIKDAKQKDPDAIFNIEHEREGNSQLFSQLCTGFCFNFLY